MDGVWRWERGVPSRMTNPGSAGGATPAGKERRMLSVVIDVQAQLVMRLGIGDYTQHAAFLPRRRCVAGASRTCHPGRYAALPSPDPIHNFRSYPHHDRSRPARRTRRRRLPPPLSGRLRLARHRHRQPRHRRNQCAAMVLRPRHLPRRTPLVREPTTAKLEVPRYDLKLWIGSGDGSAAYLPG